MAEWKELQLKEEKYTDAEAVAAVATADDYVKNVGDTINGKLIVKDSGANITEVEGTGYPVSKYLRKTPGGGGPKACASVCSEAQIPMDVNTYATGLTMNIGDNQGSKPYAANYITGLYGCADGAWNKGKLQIFLGSAGWGVFYEMTQDYFNMKDKPIKDMKNHVASALSGTKKVVEIDIGGTPYYFEVHPTKA